MSFLMEHDKALFEMFVRWVNLNERADRWNPFSSVHFQLQVKQHRASALLGHMFMHFHVHTCNEHVTYMNIIYFEIV